MIKVILTPIYRTNKIKVSLYTIFMTSNDTVIDPQTPPLLQKNKTYTTIFKPSPVKYFILTENMCNKHRLCTLLQDKKRSIKALLYTYKNEKEYYILGRQTSQQFKGSYNLIGGKFNKDENCYQSCLIREIKEELKYDTSTHFNDIFRDQGSYFTYIICRGTPVILGYIANFDPVSINKKISNDNNDTNLSDFYKEIDECKLFSEDDIINGKYKIGSFVKDSLNNILSFYK
jgi:hypothetical protein